MLSIYMIFLFKINSSTSQTSNREGLGNPTYDGLVHPITNMELPEAEATYSYAVMPQTHKYDTVTNITEERPRVNQDIPINSGIFNYITVVSCPYKKKHFDRLIQAVTIIVM